MSKSQALAALDPRSGSRLTETTAAADGIAALEVGRDFLEAHIGALSARCLSREEREQLERLCWAFETMNKLLRNTKVQ